MWAFHQALGGLVDGLLSPFGALPPIVGLTFVALLVSLGLLLVFRAASDQEALAAVKRQIHAGVFEIRLFKDEPRAILSAQAGILRHTLTYFRLSMIPMLWAMVPMVLLLIQLQFRYGYEGLRPGDRTIVSVQLSGDASGGTLDPAGPDISLLVPREVIVETPLLWIPSHRTAEWRVRVEGEGSYELQVRLGEEGYRKSLFASSGVTRRSPLRPSQNLIQQVLYPAERPLAGEASVESIAVRYPVAEVSLLGWEMHWLVAFFILTLVLALLLQKPLGVRL